MRSQVANSLLVEYMNLFDFWYAEHWGDFRGPAYKNSVPGGFITNVDSMVYLTNFSYSGPGSWNDADMLDVCNYGMGGDDAGGRKDGGMTLMEYQASLSLWSIFASPLIMSADLARLQAKHPDCLELLLNEEVLAVNQAYGPGVGQCRLVAQMDNSSAVTGGLVNSSTITAQVFARNVGNGEVALALFNRMETGLEMEVNWEEVGIPGGLQQAVRIRDLWAKANIATRTHGFGTTVPAHGVVLLRLTPAEEPLSLV